MSNEKEVIEWRQRGEGALRVDRDGTICLNAEYKCFSGPCTAVAHITPEQGQRENEMSNEAEAEYKRRMMPALNVGEEGEGGAA